MVQAKKQTQTAVSSFMGIGTLFSSLYCMLVSKILLSLPLLGGALYLAGEAALLFIRLRRQARAANSLTDVARRTGTGLTLVLLSLTAALVSLYRRLLSDLAFWRLVGIVVCMVLRPAAARSVLNRTKGQKQLWGGAVQAAFLPLVLLMLPLSALPPSTGWSLAGGCLLSAVLDAFPLERRKKERLPLTAADKADRKTIHSAYSCRVYQRMLVTVAAGIQVTLVLGFACIAVTAEALIACLALGLGCVWAVFMAVSLLMRRPRKKEADPSVIMTLGLAAWLAGLVLLTRSLSQPPALRAYAAIAVSSIGAAICGQALIGLMPDMRNAAGFAIGHTPGEALTQVLEAQSETARCTGLALALAGLTVICAFAEADASAALRWTALTLPALLLAGAAVLFTLAFPLRPVHLRRLRRYAVLLEQGAENKPMRDRLKTVVIDRSVKNYGIRAVEFVLRPFFFHRVRGAENVRLDEDIPCVFVCNHGEILGPVVCTLFSPFPFRPWSAYEMLDRSMVSQRTMDGTFQNVRGIGRRLLQWLMDHVGAPFLVWLLRSEDSIAVYHDNPRKLMQTFRETIAAMQAGDNILVFPENAATSPDHRYVQEGVSEFFTGFTMIGQMYAGKTGDCPLFVPMYADKKKRLITYGAPTRYDDQAPVNEEKQRLCDYLRGEIMRLAGLEEKQH